MNQLEEHDVLVDKLHEMSGYLRSDGPCLSRDEAIGRIVETDDLIAAYSKKYGHEATDKVVATVLERRKTEGWE